MITIATYKMCVVCVSLKLGMKSYLEEKIWESMDPMTRHGLWTTFTVSNKMERILHVTNLGLWACQFMLIQAIGMCVKLKLVKVVELVP